MTAVRFQSKPCLGKANHSAQNLQSYLGREKFDSKFMPVLKPPLVFSVLHSEKMNAFCNAQLRTNSSNELLRKINVENVCVVARNA